MITEQPKKKAHLSPQKGQKLGQKQKVELERTWKIKFV